MPVKHVFIAGGLPLVLAGCLSAVTPDPASRADAYPGAPILSRSTFEVQITGEQDQCYGMSGTPYPCFVGVLPSGKRVTFADGIRGYTFQPGQAETIRVEQINYDFTSPNAPMDVSSTVYVKVEG